MIPLSLGTTSRCAARAAFVACLVLTAWAARGATARAATAPVVAVLYFDNASGDASYDVLQKGLADMLITDLASGGLTVVERAKLQALVDEQKLQRTSFFDAKTAVATGKGLGATHAVTGTITAIAPTVRLDARMIDVATGEVVATAKVQGAAAGIFDLEQELVGKFLSALERRLAAGTPPRTKVKDMATLVEYSRGIDLADRGELDGAKQKLDAVVRGAPTFGLARVRRDELIARLAASQDKRNVAVADSIAALARAADARLATPAGPTASEDEVAARLAYRALRGNILMRRLAELMTQPSLGVAKPGKEKEVRELMLAWVDNQTRLIAEHDAARARFKYLSPRLPQADDRAAHEADLDDGLSRDAVGLRLDLAAFVLTGKHLGPSLTIAPPLASVDKALDARGLAALADAAKEAERADVDRADAWNTFRVAEDWGEVLYLRGDVEGAVNRWQAALDAHPAASRFENLERRIKEVLGLQHDHTAGELARWQDGLATCDDMSLRVALDTVTNRHVRLAGLHGLEEVVAEVEKACTGNPKADRFWPYLYSSTARSFGKHERCADFERFMAKAIAAGESKSDVEGWRRNWTACPHP